MARFPDRSARLHEFKYLPIGLACLLGLGKRVRLFGTVDKYSNPCSAVTLVHICDKGQGCHHRFLDCKDETSNYFP